MDYQEIIAEAFKAFMATGIVEAVNRLAAAIEKTIPITVPYDNKNLTVEPHSVHLSKKPMIDEQIGQAAAGLHILIYTDGSSLKNGQPDQQAGAAAVVMIQEKFVISAEHLPGATNNVGELMGIKLGLMVAANIIEEAGAPIPILLVSDSQYALEAVFGENKAKVNSTLISEIRDVVSILGCQPKWIRGHNKNIANEIADQVAYLAATTPGLNETIYLHIDILGDREDLTRVINGMADVDSGPSQE